MVYFLEILMYLDDFEGNFFFFIKLNGKRIE